MKVISRKEAKEKGLNRYFTGRLCKHGHLSVRSMSSKMCLECHKHRQRKYRKEHKEKELATQKKWRIANKEKLTESKSQYYQKNKEVILAHHKKLYKNNKEKILKNRKKYRKENRIIIAERLKRWGQKNKAKRNASARERQLRKKKACPNWVKPEEILPFYEEARRLTEETGMKHHVDHIIPLKGENVRGLHVPWNLRVISAKENIRKSNRMELYF